MLSKFFWSSFCAILAALNIGAAVARAEPPAQAQSALQPALAGSVLPGDKQQVQFRSGDGHSIYYVQSGSSSCGTPCSLRLTPGLQSIDISFRGDVHFQQDISVPGEGPARAWIQHYTRDRHFAALGLLAGGLAGVVGGILVGLSLPAHESTERFIGQTFGGLFGATGVGSIVASAAMLATVRSQGVLLRPLGGKTLRLDGIGLTTEKGGATASVNLHY